MKNKNQDLFYLKNCFEIAKKGLGNTFPNPLVGCIITKNNKIISTGYHKIYQKEHAEINALKKINFRADHSTMYINLEPCCHFGNTPPCVDKIIFAKVKKVVIAIKDPNPQIVGRSIKKLKRNNIDVVVYHLKSAKMFNEVFFKWTKTRIPFYTLKLALSLDGKLATFTGSSKYFTSFLSRIFTHHLRYYNQAVLVGINTILSDNPLLTPYLLKKQKLIPYYRIILDEKGLIPENANVLKCNHIYKTLIITKKLSAKKVKAITKTGAEIFFEKSKQTQIDLLNLSNYLGQKRISSVLVEGGGEIAWSFYNHKLLDKFYLFYAPLIIGGIKSKNSFGGKGFTSILEAQNFANICNLEIKKINKDILFKGYFNYR